DDLDLAGLGVALVLVHLVALDKLLGQELVDEGDVVVDAADLEDLLATLQGLVVEGGLVADGFDVLPARAVLALVPAALDVLEELDADFVGVEAAGGHVDDAAVL